MQMKHDLAGAGTVVYLNAEVLSLIAEHFADLLDGISKLGAHFRRARS